MPKLPADARYQPIYDAVRQIPPGRVSTYGRIAELAGIPGRARMVGRALRDSPTNADLPWHRVLRADGSLAFPRDTDGHQRQRQRLQHEGVILRQGRVDLDRYIWSLDQMLWGPQACG